MGELSKLLNIGKTVEEQLIPVGINSVEGIFALTVEHITHETKEEDCWRFE